MHNLTPKEYLKRIYNRTRSPKYRYPETFFTKRVGAVKWFPDKKQQSTKKSLIAQDYFLIGG